MDELGTRAQSSGQLDWRDIVRAGGFPRAVAAAEDYRSRVLNDYVEVFASRDIREVLGVESPQRFESFFRVIGAWTGQEINASAISRDLGIPVNTIRRWIDALERSYLVELIQPYSRNATQRVIKAAKIFAVDPALALAAARQTDPTGFHLETLTCIDMAVWRDGAAGRGVYHWRLSGGQEVDFVLQEHSSLLPVEVKAATRARGSDARHLRRFCELHPEARRGILLTSDPEIRKLDRRTIAAPWWAVI
jgi:hypothetical protein